MKRVLIVDDDFVSQKLLIEILKNTMEYDTAKNGMEALTLYEKSLFCRKPYDLILLDVSMPGMDGIDFLNFLRAKESESGVLFGEGVPVIMTTAFKKPFVKAYNSGCTDYILKPIEEDTLLNKIDDLLGMLK